MFPKLIPLWLAPLLEPYWSEITFCPAFNCSSEKFLTFFSDSFGPIVGFPNWTIFLPREWRQITTAFKFCRSLKSIEFRHLVDWFNIACNYHKSTLWNVSWSGTPNTLAAAKKLVIFSMHLNAESLKSTWAPTVFWYNFF